MRMKKCPNCGFETDDPQSNFNKNKATADGLQVYCKPCHRAKAKKYVEENKEGRRVYAKGWQERNVEHRRNWNIKYCADNADMLAEKRRAKYIRNKEHVKAYVTQWQKDNVDKVVAKRHRLRTKESGGGSFTHLEWAAVKEFYGKCVCCGDSESRLCVDHIKAVDKGGSSNIENIQPLCVSCNSSKHTKSTDYRFDNGNIFLDWLNSQEQYNDNGK